MGYAISIVLIVMGLSILFGIGGKIRGTDSNGKDNTDIYFHE